MPVLLAVLLLVQGGTPRAAPPAMGPRVIALLERAAPPPAGEVAVTLLVSGDTVVVGEQVDLVTAAWFPRELLGRLRRPPSLRPPAVAGAYSAVHPTAAGVATSRLVHGVWYDLYVAHQIIFPVREGRIAIPGAGLTFSVPAGPQYFSEERPYQLTSTSRHLVVRPLPPGAEGPVARELSLAYELPPEPARVGEPIPVDLVLEGSGNLALWPAPGVAWPEGSRGYATERVDGQRVHNGLVGGAKRFRFVVIADSSGTLALPDVRYPYFDPVQRAWREAVARAVLLPIQPRLPQPVSRRAPALMATEPWSLHRAGAVGVAAIVLLVLAPPLAVAALTRRRRLRARRRDAGRLAAASEQLEDRIRAVVPDADERRAGRLAGRLREAGLEPALSVEAAALYDLLTTARFDPAAEDRPAGADAEARRLLAAWPERARRLGRALVVVSLLVPAPRDALPAQSAGDSLYAAGAYAAAAEEFLRAAVGSPESARLWYNAGAAAWAAGQDARAAAVWLEARRLAPRSRAVSLAWRDLGLRSADLQAVGRAFPLTAIELVLLSGLVWATGWLLLARNRRVPGAVCLMAAVAGGAVSAGLYRRDRQPVAIVARPAAVRDLPHGRAQEIARAEELAVVRVRDTRPGWRLVAAGRDTTGWIPEAVLVEVRRLDYRP